VQFFTEGFLDFIVRGVVFVMLITDSLHKQLKNLELLDERVRVVVDVNLLDHDFFIGPWAFTKEHLGLSRRDHGTVVTDYVLSKK